MHHPQAGNAHPLAGQPDIEALARQMYTEWSRMCTTGLIRSVPRGFANHNARRANEGDEVSSSEDEALYASVRMARDAVTSKTVCGICGGMGHAGKIDGVGSCLTSLVGHKIPFDDLRAIRYPESYKPPSFLFRPIDKKNRYNKSKFSKVRVTEPESSESNDDKGNESARASSSSSRYKGKKKPNPSRTTSSRSRARSARNDADTSQEKMQNSETPAASNSDASDGHESCSIGR